MSSQQNGTRAHTAVRNASQLCGETLGKALLNEVLGEGAMGVVYKGQHLTLGIPVAVKVLKNNETTRASTYRERFQHEARIAARLDHPGIVRVLDFGQDKGQVYLVMEFIEGFTLEDYLRRLGTRGIKEVNCLRLLLAASLALASAHQAGIMHRDLKPSNLLLTRKGQLKIADLGLARIEDEPGMTRDNVVLGSPAYMAPESISPGSKVDHRCDIYSLGVIAYQMAFGVIPYRGTVKEILHGHLAGSAHFDLPHRFSEQTIALIQEMMDCDPMNRPATGEALAQRLRSAINFAQQRGEEPTKPHYARVSKDGSSAHRRAVGRATESHHSATSSHAKSSSVIGDFASMVRVFDATVSTHGGETIVHSTGRERFIALVALAAVIAVALAALFVAPALVSDTETKPAENPPHQADEAGSSTSP